jgi:hypothetical protein
MDEAGRRGRDGLIRVNENGEWSVSTFPAPREPGASLPGEPLLRMCVAPLTGRAEALKADFERERSVTAATIGGNDEDQRDECELWRAG